MSISRIQAEKCDILMLLYNHGLLDIVQDLLLRYFECEQLINFCVVSKDWRCMINTCYLWRKVAYTLGLRDLKHCNKDPDTDNNCLCRCGQSLNRKIRCRKNFRNGKYTKGWFSNFLNWIRIHITVCQWPKLTT